MFLKLLISYIILAVLMSLAGTIFILGRNLSAELILNLTLKFCAILVPIFSLGTVVGYTMWRLLNKIYE